MHWTQYATLVGILSVIAATAMVQSVRYLRRRGRRLSDLRDGINNVLAGYRIVSTRRNMLHLYDQLYGRDLKIDLRPLWTRLEAAGSGLGPRRMTVEAWLLHLRQLFSYAPPLSDCADAEVLARVVNEPMLTKLNSALGWTSVPARALGDTGLFAVLVHDMGQSVRYLNTQAISETRLSFDVLMNLALHGLQTPDVLAALRTAIAADTVTILKTGDSYDAARLLLLPALLRDDQRIVALVPDRDTLLISPMPDAKGWEQLHAMANLRHREDRLLANPIIVDRHGFSTCWPDRGWSRHSATANALERGPNWRPEAAATEAPEAP